MTHSEIADEYARMTDRALTVWAQGSDVGEFVGLPSGYQKISPAIGSFFTPSTHVAELLAALFELALADPKLTLVPSKTSHFTFLALAPHIWSTLEELPEEVFEVKALCDRHLSELRWPLSDLRLIPGANFLLLAGFPSQGAIDARYAITRDILASSWRQRIEQRYLNHAATLPPKIWHTTLCRYPHARLPSRVRALYHEFRALNFGEIDLPSPKLRAINYDWSFAELIIR